MHHSRPRQVSPLSTESNDPSFLSRYEIMKPTDNPYGACRPLNNSPPSSQHQGGSHTDGHSRSTSSRSPGGSRMSSTSSVIRSNEVNGMYSPISESGRPFLPQHEDSLLEHYHVLRGFLGSSLAQDTAAKSSRARDKLLRLSPTQFHELSTDVYDELLRREDDRLRRSPDVPPYLLPTNSFHPKRNQARQKLSTLPPERFKQLATDVYFELERRVPRLGAVGMDRAASPAMSTMSSASSYRGGPRGPPPSMRGPPGPPRPASRGQVGRAPAPDRSQFPARTSSHDYGRPLPKTFQSNTIVPNKFTMVEGDDTEDEDSIGPLGLHDNAIAPRALDQEQVDAFESRIAELQAKVTELETSLGAKDIAISDFESSKFEQDKEMIIEREGWNKARDDFERQISDLHESASAHQVEREQTHQMHADREAGLRDQLEDTINDLQGQIDALQSENSSLKLESEQKSDRNAEEEWRQQADRLQEELSQQRRITDEVKENATHFLEEMRALSEQSEAAFEKEEQLQGQVRALEAEVEDWKTRYAKTRTELRTLKASSIGLPLQDMAKDALASRHQLLSHDGLVNDMDVTNYQISIDELLQSARRHSVDATLDRMKAVIGHVQHITNHGKDDYTGLPSPADSPNPMSPQLYVNGSPPTHATLKARVARNATGLITATRNYVSSDGLSPVSLIDVAAANLTAAVVDYVKTVGVKASNSDDLRADTHMDDDYELLPATTHVPEIKTKLVEPNNEPSYDGSGWHSRLKGSFDSTYSNDLSTVSAGDDESEYNSYR